MSEIRPHHFLPALMGSLHQQAADGELVLEQNDGTRSLYWSGGRLTYLRSDAVGEQFGNFLIRRGVLDMASLKELLAEGDGIRVGDRVVQMGLMSQEEAHERLQELLGSVLLHAMEHPIIELRWNPGAHGGAPRRDLPFRLDHRWLVWDTFQSAKIDRELVSMFFHRQPDWRWEALPNLLEVLSDLPLTPDLAYALTLLGTEPLGCSTIASLTKLPPEGAARLVATMWALGALKLVRGKLPLLPSEDPSPASEAEPPTAPLPDSGSESAPAPESSPTVPPGQENLLLSSTGSFYPDLFNSDLFNPPHEEPLPELDEQEAAQAAERAHQSLVKARSYLMQDRTSEAIRALEESTRLDGDSPGAFETWMLLGRLRLSNPAWATRAIQALQKASRLNPKSAEPFILMGELYQRKGFEANAQGCFRRAQELDPSLTIPVDRPAAEEEAMPADEGQGGLMGKLKGLFRR